MTNKYLIAQNKCYPQILKELTLGFKMTHWMWYVFPQIEGLGQSPTAKLYALKNRAETLEYIHHPELGSRYKECVALILTHEKSAMQIFGPVDAMKLHSSLTLFQEVAPDPLFKGALEKFFDSKLDEATLNLLD
jgi:uncharacterized protein (DUF1810 family)